MEYNFIYGTSFTQACVTDKQQYEAQARREQPPPPSRKTKSAAKKVADATAGEVSCPWFSGYYL